ncbi:inovirus-type Gp2 protein [Xenophilus sp. Marseille-Q4582]|uniref:inovirus-type Gp2 protein n=1 Tax=Xenophilus sp. Marseille-Q4582 TaxID=2866600 RepID=UPI001CE433D6|nr:inovirus-type Gp2 protein [Xenophilus sp. Marseille-Q4582]
MNDSFEPQKHFDNEGECLDAFMHEEILNLPSTGAPACLVDDITRARLEVKKVIRYALIILDQEPKKAEAVKVIHGARSARDSTVTTRPNEADRQKKQARQLTYAGKALKLDLDLIRYEYPGHGFHPCAMALMHAAQAAKDALNAWRRSPEGLNASNAAQMRKREQLAQEILAEVQETSRTASYREEAERIRHTTWQRMDSTKNLIEHMFNQRSRLLCVRVDLRYRHFFLGERYDASLPGHPSFEMVGVHREHLLNILRRQIFKDCLFGYILRIEWAPGTGFHLHLMLLIDGRERRGGVEIGNLIGRKWRTEVTQGHGYDFNCNRKAMNGGYKMRGTGMFERADAQGCRGLMKAAEYLAKADHFISFYRSDRQRTYFRSQIRPPAQA